MLFSICLADAGGEVHAEHGDTCLLHGGVFLTPHLQFHDFFFQQGGEEDFRHTVVLHQVFEDGVVNRVCYQCHNNPVFMVSCTKSLQR